MFSERVSASTVEYIHKWEILTEVELVMYFRVIRLLRQASTICGRYDAGITRTGSVLHCKCFHSVVFFIMLLKC